VPKSSPGFTLVEVSVLLLAVSLMLATSVKAAEWVDASKVRSLAQEFREGPMIVESYRAAHRALPGDDPAAGRFAGMTTAPGAGDGVVDGGWNSDAAADESFLLWQHLRAAGLAGGPVEQEGDGRLLARPPRNAFGGRIGIQGGRSGPIADFVAAQLMCSARIPARAAERVDRLLDDGIPDRGRMRAAAESGEPAPFRPGVSAARAAVAHYAEGDLVTLCLAF